MDWHGVPEGVDRTIKVDVWHELVEEKKDLTGLDIPEYDPKEPAPAINTVWPSSSQSGKFIDFQPEVSDDISFLTCHSGIDYPIESGCCYRLPGVCSSSEPAFLSFGPCSLY
jgi:hypothetical protein